MGIADRYLQTLENQDQVASGTPPKTAKPLEPVTFQRKSPSKDVNLTKSHSSTSPLKQSVTSQPRGLTSSTNVSPTKSGFLNMPKPDRNPLMHNEDLTASQISWDKERKSWATYEYLCHVAEAKEWMEQVLGRNLGPAEDFPESLQNGILLAQCVQRLRPQLMKWPVFEHKRLQYRHTENITQFFWLLEDLKIPQLFLFDMTDLYEKRNLPKVIYCIHAVSHFIAESAQITAVNDLVGKLNFSDDQISSTKKQIAGHKMPNFKAMNRQISGANDIYVDDDMENQLGSKNDHAEMKLERARLPAPKIENLQLSDDEYELQVRPQRRKNTSQTRKLSSRNVTPSYLYNNRFSQYDDRKRQTSNYRNLSSFTSLRNKLMGSVEQMFSELESLEPEIAVLEGVCRGFLVRKHLDSQRMQTQKDESTTQLCSVIRGQQLRASLHTLNAQLNSPSLPQLQAFIRGKIYRNEFNRSVDDAHGIKHLQAIGRAQLLRRNLRATRQALESKQVSKSIKQLQSTFRGVNLRFKLGCLYDDADREILSVIQVQSLIRGRRQAQWLKQTQHHWQQHLEDVIHVQSLWRAKVHSSKYRNFVASAKPSFETIKPFLHLLVDNAEDYNTEVELEQISMDINKFVKDNEMVDERISKLDTKMALLVKNDLSVDELVLRQQKQNRDLIHDLQRERDAIKVSGIPKTTSKARLHSSLNTEFDLKSLSRPTRERIEHYQSLLYILQTQPQYTTRLLGCTPPKNLSMSNLVLQIFGNASTKRENYFLLKLLSKCVREFGVGSPENASVWQIVSKLNKKFESVECMRQILDLPMKTLRTMSDQLLLYDPSLIFKHLNNDELESEEAIKDPVVRQQFVKNMISLREVCQLILNSLLTNMSSLPYHIKFLAMEAYNHVNALTKDSRLAHSSALQVIISQFLMPAIANAEALDLLDAAVGHTQMNLTTITRIIHQMSLIAPFPKQGVEAFLQPLNDFISTSGTELAKKFDSLHANTKDLCAHYKVTDADDLVSCEKLFLQIKVDTLLAIHQLSYQNLHAIAAEDDQCFAQVMQQLGNVPHDAREVVDLKKLDVVKLELNSNCTANLNTADPKSLIAITKRCLGYVLRVQNDGPDLLTNLISNVDFEHEHKYNLLLDTDNLREAAGELGNLTFRELKVLTLEHVLQLEGTNTISREDGYQRLVTELAEDIKNKDVVRKRKQIELASKTKTLESIKEKNEIYKQRLDIFSRNIDDALSRLQHAVHQQNLQKSKRFQKFQLSNRAIVDSGHPKYGQYKYNADKLTERGVLVRLRGYQERQYKDVHFVFSGYSVGKFTLEILYKNIMVPNGCIYFTLDDLLNFQYQGLQYIHYLDDQVQFHTDRLLNLVLHKFFGTN